LSRSAEGGLLAAWDDDVAKLLAGRLAVVGAAGFSAGLRRKRFLRNSNMQDSLPAVHRQAVREFVGYAGKQAT